MSPYPAASTITFPEISPDTLVGIGPARPFQADRALGPVTAAVIEPPVYDSLVEMSTAYWANLEAAAGPGYGPSPAYGT